MVRNTKIITVPFLISTLTLIDWKMISASDMLNVIK